MEKIFTVKVKAGAKKEEISIQQDHIIAKVAQPPVEGKANERLVELLAEHFKVPKSQIKILKGLTGKNKIVKVNS